LVSQNAAFAGITLNKHFKLQTHPGWDNRLYAMIQRKGRKIAIPGRLLPEKNLKSSLTN